MVKARSGFTLVEVLVVIAILAVLMSLLLPAITSARDAAARLQCANHQRNLALAITRFELDKGFYPGYRNLQAIDKDDIGRPTGWAFPLLPYLEQQFVYEQHGPKGPDQFRGTLPNLTLPLLVCPADAMAFARTTDNEKYASSYVVNGGQLDVAPSPSLPSDHKSNGIFLNRVPYAFDGSLVRIDSVSSKYVATRDGLAKTLLLSENSDAGNWIDDREIFSAFLWEATLVNGVPAPQSLKRINEAPGASYAAVLRARNLANTQTLLACTGCYPGSLPYPLPYFPRVPRDPTEPPPSEETPSPGSPIPDPTSGTPGTTAPSAIPGNVAFARPASFHQGGVVAAFADGHTTFLSQDIDYVVYCQLMTPNGADAMFPGTAEPVPAVYRNSTLDPEAYR